MGKIADIAEAQSCWSGVEICERGELDEWANVAGAMRRSKQLAPAKQALSITQTGESSRAWLEHANLLDETNGT